MLARCCALARASEGRNAPHPLSACVLVPERGSSARVVEATHVAQGATRAEILCFTAASGSCARGTAYVNLEPTHGDVAGEFRAVDALARSGVKRVVVGLRHPLPGLRGRAIASLRAHGIEVDVFDDKCDDDDECASMRANAAAECRLVNEALLYRVATGLPLSVYKYAMTLDGRIATSTGHSSWVTGAEARERVFRERKRSDAVVVGGQTVRRDDPRLTTREADGFQPARVVLSRSLNLPEEAKLWNVAAAPTIVLTVKGRRPDFQSRLRAKGVDVVEFDDLTPLAAARYMYARGYLRCFWECGGSLAAPALSAGVFHSVMAFVAPKLIGGGADAPTPIGDLGIQAMHDALPLSGVALEVCGRDILMRGYVPNATNTGRLGEMASGRYSVRGLEFHVGESADDDERADDGTLISVEKAVASLAGNDELCHLEELPALNFFKAWDENGALSNFAPFPVRIDGVDWLTVEHYYQAQKFAGVDSKIARDAMEDIRLSESPEGAAKIGRSVQVKHPECVRSDWESAKLDVMRRALVEKLTTYEGPRSLLLNSVCADGRQRVIEKSPMDAVWGAGRDGTGRNLLGVLLQEIREELLRAK